MYFKLNGCSVRIAQFLNRSMMTKRLFYDMAWCNYMVESIYFNASFVKSTHAFVRFSLFRALCSCEMLCYKHNEWFITLYCDGVNLQINHKYKIPHHY